MVFNSSLMAIQGHWVVTFFPAARSYFRTLNGLLADKTLLVLQPHVSFNNLFEEKKNTQNRFEPPLQNRATEELF